MPVIDIKIDSPVSISTRARQVSSMFDVPFQDRQQLSWSINAPWETKKWNVGLIVGPSGSGKSTIMKKVFGEPRKFDYVSPSVIDDFNSKNTIEEISVMCGAVGFNTIPAWLRPFKVLSNGEQFRVNLARLMLETPEDEVIVVDEFTSVVDRQIATIGANAMQKFVRKNDRQFVGVTCHYDIVDWLQPDWIIDAAKQTFVWGSVQPRPQIEVEIKKVGYEYWKLFSPFHYLTSDLNKSAQCFVAFVNDVPTAFAGVLHRPHPKVKDIKGLSRLVTLPDWQGFGLIFVLSDALGAAYKANGYRLRTYPAHPAFIRSYDKSAKWLLKQKPGYGGGVTTTIKGVTSNSRGIAHGRNAQLTDDWRHGSRPCAVFEYAGEAMEDKNEARNFLQLK